MARGTHVHAQGGSIGAAHRWIHLLSYPSHLQSPIRRKDRRLEDTFDTQASESLEQGRLVILSSLECVSLHCGYYVVQ